MVGSLPGSWKKGSRSGFDRSDGQQYHPERSLAQGFVDRLEQRGKMPRRGRLNL